MSLRHSRAVLRRQVFQAPGAVPRGGDVPVAIAAVRPSSHNSPKGPRVDAGMIPFSRIVQGRTGILRSLGKRPRSVAEFTISSSNASISRPTTRTSRCFATATDAHPHADGNSDQSFIGPNVSSPTRGPHAMSPLQIVTSGANKWTVPSALPTQSKSPPQLTAWALSAQRAANMMYQARSLLQKIGRDLIRMTAAMSWATRSVQVSQAPAPRSQTTC